MFHGGKLKAMPAKLVSDNGEHVVIRPLAFCKESEIALYAQLQQFPIIPCNLCGSQPNLQRQHIKNMLQQWQTQYPGRIESMFTAMQNVVPSHLCDNELFDFKSIDANSGIIDGGDIGFDQPTIATPASNNATAEESLPTFNSEQTLNIVNLS
jgi:tRNA 2-thiocytidine biosynthesis protein TtcA